jgi:hypothetical protein
MCLTRRQDEVDEPASRVTDTDDLAAEPAS